MRIAIITTWFPPIVVGSGNRLYEIGRRLSKKFEVHVYTVGTDETPKEEELHGMYVYRYHKFNYSKSIEQSYFLNLKFGFSILKDVKDHYDIIECNIVSKILPYISYVISKRIKTPFVETWHEVMYEHNFNLLNPILALPAFFLEFQIPRLANVNIAVSKTTKNRLVNLLKVDPSKVVVIPNGINLNDFRQVSVKKRYGRILYAGRLESHKQVDKLILAYKNLKKEYSDIELIIVGRGPKKSYLEELASKLSLDVKFLDLLPYKKFIKLMKSSWIFVLPSIKEGQGIVLLEAMAAGTPPIAVKAEGSGVVDIIKDNYNGLLVSSNQESLESAIRKLLTNYDLYARLRKNGLQFIKEYDWDRISERVSELYKKIAKK